AALPRPSTRSPARRGRSRGGSCSSGPPRRGGERLVEVPQDVLDVLETHRDAYEVLGDPRGLELLRAQLLVRGRGRVDHEGARVADVREVAREHERLDEHPPDVARGTVLGARDPEGEDRTG